MSDYVGIVNEDLTDNPTLRQVTEPVALFFTYIDKDLYDEYMKNPQKLIDIQSTCARELIDALVERGYPAVDPFHPLAAHPASIVVTSRGIQTPFLEPQEARSFAQQLIKDINHTDFARPLSYVLGVKIGQMPPPVINDGPYPNGYKYLNPDRAIYDFAVYCFGENFINDMYKIAWQNSEDADNWLKNLSYESRIFTGTKVIKEYNSVQARNDIASRHVNLGTTDYKKAALYAGEMGIIHHFETVYNQELYADFVIERGLKGESEILHRAEGIITQDNQYLETEIHLGGRRFVIPLQNEEWMLFMEMHRAVCAPISTQLAQRRINQLRQAKANGGRAVTFIPDRVKLENLVEEKTFTSTSDNLQLEDVLLTERNKVREEFYKFRKNFYDSKKQTISQKNSRSHSYHQEKSIKR